MDYSQIAEKYHSWGLSVLPIDDKKVPIGKWKERQTELLPPAEKLKDCRGIGIVCGYGGLECVDIDCKYDLTGTMYQDFKNLIAEIDKGILSKLVVQKTVGGGYHFVYKCKTIQGNQKLASRKGITGEESKALVLIETRGIGGYIQVAPTTGYEMVYKTFADIQEISEEERETLLNCARTFNQIYEQPILKKEYNTIFNANKSPFEDYNERGDVLSLLVEFGWKEVYKKGQSTYLLRPGGTGKISADWSNDLRIFYNWSTSSVEFEGNHGYNASQVLAYLQFNKNFSECAKWLLKNGYGSLPERKQEVQNVKSVISLEDDNFDFIADPNYINDGLARWRNGTFVKGVTTGIKELDEYFLLKRGNFNVINGKDNVGKSVFMWYILLLSAIFHKWKWIIYSNENTSISVTKRLIEFYVGTKIEKQTPQEFEEAKKFVEEHFVIISNDKIFNYKDLLNICEKLSKNKKYDGILLDPYNSLKIDLAANSKLNTHEYHYEAASEMQIFAKKNDICVYLNCHVHTFAAREDKAPNKADTEGGAKFANKADDFLTFDRKIHSENWRDMEIYVRKIKEIETGGRYTQEDSPFKMTMNNNQCGYTVVGGADPVFEWRNEKNGVQQIPLKPNTNFYETKQEQANNDDPEDIKRFLNKTKEDLF